MMTVYQGHQSSSRMFVGAMVVVGFHLAAFVAFKSGMVRPTLAPIVEDMKAYFVEPVLEPPPPPPAPQPVRQERFEQPVIPYIPVEIDIPLPPVESPVTVAEAVAPVTREATAATGEGPQIVDFQVDSRYPLTRPHYPPQDIRLGHEGLVTLRIYVLPNGRVGEAMVAVSSGYPRLDDSAVREALKAWRFKPRTMDGSAVGAWGTFKVRFKLD